LSAVYQAILMLVQCLLNQLCAKDYISRLHCEDFMQHARNTAAAVTQTSNKKCCLEEEVCQCIVVIIDKFSTKKRNGVRDVGGGFTGVNDTGPHTVEEPWWPVFHFRTNNGINNNNNNNKKCLFSE